MTDRVEAVLFDIDGTLCEYHRSSRALLAEAFEDVSVDPFFAAEEYLDRYREFTADSESMTDLRERCFAALAREAGHDGSVGRAVARAYAAERDHTNVYACPGVEETLDALDGEYALAAVTNGGPEMQTAKLRALGVADRFETVVHAGYDAPAKPAPEPFHDALDTLGAAPGRAVHVGDSLGSDVAGAQAAGLEAAWLRNGSTDAPDPRPDYVLDALPELRDCLD